MATIKQDTIRMLTRKSRPMSYEGIVTEIHKKHPDAQTTVKTVAWYASRLRAEGQEVHVKRAGPQAKAKQGKKLSQKPRA